MARGRFGKPAWVASSSVVVAALGAVALATTVVVARSALEDASAVVVRGEGESLVQTLRAELGSSPMPDGADAMLAAALSKHAAAGLRYVALAQGGEVRAQAGEASMVDAARARPGALTLGEHRVRLSANLGPPNHPPDEARGPHGRRHHGRPPWARDGDDGPPPPPGDDGPPPQDDDDDPGGPPFRRHDPSFGPGPPPGGPPVLIVEFETPVLDKLRADVARTAVVAAIAGAALLAFAAAWSRSMLRLAAATAKAERDRRLVALGQMSGVMAHELRNPLASLKGHAQLLEEILGDAVAATDADAAREALVQSRAKAARVVGEAERLERLTSSLLEFAREGALDASQASPREIVERAIEHLHGASVDVDVAAAPPALACDAGRLARALANLVENAAHAGGDAPVSVRAYAAEDDVVFEVRDRGPGLPDGERDRIFEPFVTTKTRGTGLGLAIARRIAELHGGSLDGANHPDGGAVFTLRVPLR